MAETTVDASLSDKSRTVHATFLGQPRDDDPTTLSLRGEAPIDLEDIISNLNGHSHDTNSAASSSAGPATSIFSSHKESDGTKPTSNGTSYPIVVQNSKRKGTVLHDASSLSATHGSGSETEKEAIRRTDLLGLGDWAGAEPSRLPRTTTKRQKVPKKPVVIIQKDRSSFVSNGETTMITQQSHRNKKDVKYLRQRRNRPDLDEIDLVEEGRLPTIESEMLPVPLSRARLVVTVLLVIAIILTFAISAWGASYTGKDRMHCTKGIIFGATVSISLFTVFAMITARRALQEALLTGLLELLVGFTLLMEIKEFL